MAIYTVNLSRVRSYSRRKRASKAMKILREELEEREGGEVSVDPEVNNHVWKDGIENPPRKIEVEVVETGDGLRAVMPGTELEEPEPEPEPEAAEEETEEEVEEAEEAEAEVEEQETEEGEETEDETGEETEVDYSEIVSGTVSEAKDAIEELGDPDYEAALGAEKDNKDRKTLKEWLESRM